MNDPLIEALIKRISVLEQSVKVLLEHDDAKRNESLSNSLSTYTAPKPEPQEVGAAIWRPITSNINDGTHHCMLMAHRKSGCDFCELKLGTHFNIKIWTHYFEFPSVITMKPITSKMPLDKAGIMEVVKQLEITLGIMSCTCAINAQPYIDQLTILCQPWEVTDEEVEKEYGAMVANFNYDQKALLRFLVRHFLTNQPKQDDRLERLEKLFRDGWHVIIRPNSFQMIPPLNSHLANKPETIEANSLRECLDKVEAMK